MFDARLRLLIDPPLNRCGAWLARSGVAANQITLAGFSLGMAAALAVWWGAFGWAFALIALNRLADGLDGAVARVTGKTDRGGYLDISLDFVFYGAIPLAFALHDPPANALAASVLLASFYANGTAFLAFAIAASHRGLSTSAQGAKSFYYLGGIAEGGETIAVFLIMCLLPWAFATIAWVSAIVCLVSAAARIANSAIILGKS